MEITVNGKSAKVDAGTDDAAVALLREDLGLTGAKVACGTGVCGSCTILVGGTPVASCLMSADALEGCDVTTVEGLNGTHPVQRAFAAHDALQCGYCTPGFVVEAAAFVDRWRAAHGDVAPTRSQIAQAMAGHLCRCGAYESIQAAIAAACAGRHDSDDPVPARVEAWEKITGRARYTTDVRLEGQLEGVIIRSTLPHARVGAVQVDGVAVADLLPADRVVRYVGQPIAAVAAPTRAAALAAAATAEVAYTPLPAVLTTVEAQKPDAPTVYDSREERRGAPKSNEAPLSPAKWQGNVRGPSAASWRAGTAMKRIDAARERGDQRLVSATFTTAAQLHTAMEPHACVARWDEQGELHLHLSTQAVSMVAAEVAKRWSLKPAQIHIVADHVGGGFGSKVHITSDLVAAVELARTNAAPVRVVLDRAEELTDGGSRPATSIELSLLADADANLAALSMDSWSDGGTSIGSNAAALGRYIYGNAPRQLRDYDVLTHQPPGAPFRGPGGPPMAWALEQAVDEIAHRCGEDPIALRQRWDGNPKRRALYEWAAALPAWTDRQPVGSPDGRFRRGVGVAATNWLYLLDPGTEVELVVEQGVVVARTATQDIGTGSRSVIADIVRTELDLPAGRVRVELGRTGTVYGPGSVASSATPSIGPAAIDAARRLRAALPAGPVLASLGGAEGLRVVGRRRRDRRGYVTPFPIGKLSIGRGFAGAVHLTEVEVDARLATVRVTRVWCGIAAGHIYAERLARSQCEGGIIQGIGYALFEQRHVDPATGFVLTANLEDYRIPGIGDTPEINLHFHQEGWDHVTGRGVGLGEMSTVGMAASIGNAVYAATGWRPQDLPIRPDRLREGINR